MDDMEFYIWCGIIIVLLIILFMAYRKYTAVDTNAACMRRGPAQYVQVIYNQQPLLVTDSWFLDNIRKIKSSIVDIYANMGSAMCKQQLLPLLDGLSTNLDNTIKSMGSDGQFCSLVYDYLSRKGPGYDMWVQTKTQLTSQGKSMLTGVQGTSRSDTDTQSPLDISFSNIISSLDGIMDVVASKACTVDGKVNMDYLHNVVNRLRSICDYDAQASLISPVVDWGEQHVLAPVLTASACALPDEAPSSLPAKESATFGKPSTSANAVIQTTRSAFIVPPKPPMMKQIYREGVSGGPLSERSNKLKKLNRVNKATRSAPKPMLRNMVKSG